ncbi:MAG: hypothetical protein GWN18_09035, partial [Thermoplasmata archaeon]|nr:hypothetical protein [Thermoplasmata archaeon]NIS12182.1 hypothetical protein [Thermoplasmata archaeon]NIS20099.1 hypothetical protein [Thermoplasmata archaeon]NIT77422.1 hypothetical protein [Thermoplasmata archaeon]NIU49201.1 hypothetical protein [Thermoplasmata archaeon]
ESTVSGVVNVQGTATDPDGGPVTVRYAISVRDNWQEAVMDGDVWSFSWDTNPLPNQQYSIFVRADDGVH